MTTAWIQHFKRFHKAAVYRLASPHVPEMGSLTYWRAHILFSVLFTGLILGLFASISGIVVALKENAWGLTLVDGLSYLVGLKLFFSKRLRYEIRAAISLLLCYGIGITVLFSVGPLSGAAAWLFAFAVLVAVLLGLKPALWAILLNAASISIFAWLVSGHRLAVDFAFFRTSQAMVAAGVNFAALNGIVAVSVASLVQGLVETNEKKAALTQNLEQERHQLIEAKNTLELEINERKMAEKALSDSEEKYRHFIDNAPIGMFTINTMGEFTYINKKLLEITGYRPEDWLNKPFHPVVHPDDLEMVLNRVNQRITGKGDQAPNELRIFHASGTIIWVETVSESIYAIDPSGDRRPVGMQTFITDITARKRAEQELRDSKKKYKDLVLHAPAGIFEFDMQTIRFISVNDVMCDYTGYTEEEFLELDPFDIICDESKEVFTRLLQHVFANQPQELSSEYKIKGKNQKEFWVLSNSRFFYEEGIPNRAMSVVHDMTDIRRAEAERRKLEVELQNARKLESLGTLAGGVAHDLNNILSGVVSYPDLLLMDLEADSPFWGPLQSIKKSGEKAAEIVQDLLTLARRGVASRKAINLNQIVRDFMVSPEYGNLIKNHNDVRIETRLSENIFNIMGSEVHLSKIVMNLLANAADAMPAGGEVSIATQSRYLDTARKGYETIPEGEYTTLKISDKGIGIPAADIERIFEPFYTKKAMGRSGTGLGMSVVWGSVKDHGGYIDLITEEGQGTTFTLYFPASRSEMQTSAIVHIDDYLGHGESILIIDDSPEQRALAEQMMLRLGYDVTTAASGEEAVKQVSRRAYDVLILDMIMPPGMNGLETYKQILDIVPDQKAVIASGYAMSEHVHETQRLGAGRYIKKPFTLEKIGLAVRAELDKSLKKAKT